jgi:hypothetical protein
MKSRFERKPNTSNTFTNDPSAAPIGVKAPHESGKALIVCVHCGENSLFYHDIWINTSESGKEYRSHRFKAIGGAPSSPTPTTPASTKWQQTAKNLPTAAQSTQDEFNDDIPF